MMLPSRLGCPVSLKTANMGNTGLYEVPVQEGDEQSPGHHDEKWPPGHSRCMPGLRHKDVPNRKGRIVRRSPKSPANSYRK